MTIKFPWWIKVLGWGEVIIGLAGTFFFLFGFYGIYQSIQNSARGYGGYEGFCSMLIIIIFFPSPFVLATGATTLMRKKLAIKLRRVSMAVLTTLLVIAAGYHILLICFRFYYIFISKIDIDYAKTEAGGFIFYLMLDIIVFLILFLPQKFVVKYLKANENSLN